MHIELGSCSYYEGIFTHGVRPANHQRYCVETEYRRCWSPNRLRTNRDKLKTGKDKEGQNYQALSYDVASGSEITPCNKIDKPLVVYRFTGNVMTSITTLRT